MIAVAALFVEKDGVYSIAGVDPWDVDRDARNYPGPLPVVAHPPCERWGRYWGGGPSAKVKRKLGDDNGCFGSALAAVRRWGGILEHPEASHAWSHFLLVKPPKAGGWIQGGNANEWTCCVEQGHYGHRARKATWLLFVGKRRPRDLIWGPSKGERLDEGFHSKAERDAKRKEGMPPRKRLSKRECVDTPIAFRDVLLNLVVGVNNP